MDDEFWMARALLIANKALSINELPVCAILVYNNFEISYCLNSCYVYNFCHAENNVFSRACFYLSKNFLSECTLYVTLEPCNVCFSFICYHRIKKLVFGVCSGVNNNKYCSNNIKIKSGILENESLKLLKKFFIA